MKNDNDIEGLFQAIRARFAELNNKERQSVSAHLRSIANWHQEANDYPEPHNINFPTRMHVAYAVCHPSCGAQEFIVDGSTQECQSRGSLMFRTEVKEYTLSKGKTTGAKRRQPNQAL